MLLNLTIQANKEMVLPTKILQLFVKKHFTASLCCSSSYLSLCIVQVENLVTQTVQELFVLAIWVLLRKNFSSSPANAKLMNFCLYNRLKVYLVRF